MLAECSHRLRRREDAEEATQTTFLRAFGALRRGERPRSERAWLLTIARNVCATNAERARKRGEVEFEPELLDRVAAHVDVEVDVVDEALARALAALPEGQRRAIVLRACHGLSYAEIAAELGVTVAAVETWIYRARRTLAASLPDRRRVLSFDFPSLVAAFKSVAGGGSVAAKVALATVIAGTTLGAAEVVDRGTAEERGPVARRDAPVSAGAPTRSESTPALRRSTPRTAATARANTSDSASAATPNLTVAPDAQRTPQPAAAETSRQSVPEQSERSTPTVAPPAPPPVDEALQEGSLPLPPVEVKLPALPPLAPVPLEHPQLPAPELPTVELPTLP